MRRERGRPHGFTLLEVMVGLALLSAALMAVADLSGNALRNHAYARDLSNATLLARGKMGELEERFEDEGFKDLDETIEGSFEAEKHPEVKWKAEVIRPDTSLGPDQLVAKLAGVGDIDELMAAFLGDGAKPKDGGPQQGLSPAAGMAGNLLKTQVAAFGETLKKSLRELRLTVSWMDGKRERSFMVTTHLVVINPRAPGGAKQEWVDR